MSGTFLRDRLPEHLAEDEFLLRFLGIFQAQADRLEQELVGIRHVADPTVAPPAVVRWLGTWLGVQAIDPASPVERQRTLVRTAGRDLARRGTADGLRRLLEVLSGTTVAVHDTGSVRRAGGPPPGPKAVWIDIGPGAVATDEHLVDTVRRELPAGLALELRVGGRVLVPDGGTWTGPAANTNGNGSGNGNGDGTTPARPASRRREPLRAVRDGATTTATTVAATNGRSRR